MKRVLLVAATAAACAVVPRAAASSEGPSFAALPSGEVGAVPRAQDAPAFIGGQEKVPGFFLAQQRVPVTFGKRTATGKQPSWVFLFASAEEAKQFTSAPAFSMPPRDSSTCFTTADRAGMFTQAFAGEPDADEPSRVEWPSWFEARPTLRFDESGGGAGRKRPGISANGAVLAVHAERLVRGDGGRAALEMTDAWIDPATRGARLIAASALPLVRLASAPSGIEVYAARSKDGVEVVVTSSRVTETLEPSVRQFARQFSRLNASLGAGRAGNSDCGHIRVALHPRVEAGPQMSVVQTVALLPALEVAEAPGGSPETQAAKVANAQMAGFKAIQSMRKRPVDVSLSVTQTASDAEPVVSVAVGWAGREERR